MFFFKYFLVKGARKEPGMKKKFQNSLISGFEVGNHATTRTSIFFALFFTSLEKQKIVAVELVNYSILQILRCGNFFI